MKSILALVSTNLTKILLIIIGILIVIVIFKSCRNNIKEVIVTNEVTKIDSVFVSDANVVSKQTYKIMHDSLTNRIKSLQKELGIKTRDLNLAMAMNSTIHDTVFTPIYIIKDSIGCDSIRMNYSDRYTQINVEGNTCNKDSVLISYSINSDLTIINHFTYKPAKCKLGKWFNRVFKIGQKESVSIKPTNPNLDIKNINTIKIYD